MSKLKIAGAAIALVFAASTTAFAQTSAADEEAARKAKTPSTEGVVTSAEMCQYEGGFLSKFRTEASEVDVCMAPIRPASLNMQSNDGLGQGVFKCEGNGAYTNELAGSYCRIFLQPKPRKKTRAELEAELEALTEAELSATN